jgi:taurine dioxygenase
MSLEIKPLAAPVGAEVFGLDAHAPISADDAATLRRAFERHHVLVVRDQVLDEAQQVAFAGCFGTVEMAREKSLAADRPEIMVISNVRRDGQAVGRLPDGEVEWHFDKMYYPVPNIAAVLHAVEIPDRGGETKFSDTSLVYEALPETLKARLASLHVSCAYDYEATHREARVITADTRTAVHPIVRTLPNGRKSIYAAPLMVDGLVELSQPESDELLAEVYSYFGRPENTYEHTWRIGDTLIWDNRCCAHKRNDFDPTQRRFLRRVAIANFATHNN